MTDDEAKTKWCPFVRLGGNLGSDAAGSTWNRWPGDKDPYDGSYCIGSACMAWRYTNKSAMHDRNRWIDTAEKTADEAYAQYLKDFPLEGRCGLAGA